jgi:hypothetical protein
MPAENSKAQAKAHSHTDIITFKPRGPGESPGSARLANSLVPRVLPRKVCPLIFTAGISSWYVADVATQPLHLGKMTSNIITVQ